MYVDIPNLIYLFGFNTFLWIRLLPTGFYQHAQNVFIYVSLPLCLALYILYILYIKVCIPIKITAFNKTSDIQYSLAILF